MHALSVKEKVNTLNMDFYICLHKNLIVQYGEIDFFYYY